MSRNQSVDDGAATGAGGSSGPGVASSRLADMRRLTPAERLASVAEAAALTQEARGRFGAPGALPLATADGMIENVVGTFELPLGVATNFTINGRDYLVPMVVEEPSVVAAASYMARIARANGGFEATTTDPLMRAQIQILGLGDPHGARLSILGRKAELIAAANACDAVLVGLGGGCRDVEVQLFETSPRGPMVVVHLIVDVRDAMGANTVNTMAERIAPQLEAMTDGRARLRILSNYADLRLARARVRLSPESLATAEFSGARMIEGILDAQALAVVDPYRAVTHNKGIMNGIDPVVVATGNDWRAVEAGAHAWAARSGRYRALTDWEEDNTGHLVGTLEVPMAVGIVGGATRTHPVAQAALKVMNLSTAAELAQIIVTVGLAQNLAALRALATEGIQRGHMALHARNIAIVAGAEGPEVEEIGRRLAAEGDVRTDRARALLDEMRAKAGAG